MQIPIHIPFIHRQPPKRKAPARRLQFLAPAASSALHSHLTVHQSDLGLVSDFGFTVSDFRVRATRIAMTMILAAAILPFTTSAQSLWCQDSAKSQFSDKRASSIGDILTIVVQETTTSSKDSKTATGKSASVDASISSFFYSPGASKLLTKAGQLPALQYTAKNDFSGGGTIANSENIIARVAVKVIDVLPNRNLVVEGRKETAFSGEHQTVILRGIVRPEDVAANDTVFSYNVADATINILSKGQVTDSQRKGWFTRIWDKLSPF